MIKEPTAAGYFVKSSEHREGINTIRLKKYNYTNVYGPLDSGIIPFSFFGTPSDTLDVFGRATNLGYGRIDSDMDAVSPKRESLGPLGGSLGAGTTQLALTFVAQAFNDLQHNLASEARSHNALKLRGGPYSGMLPVRGWQNVDTRHTNFLENMYLGYLMPYLRENKRDETITSFDEFLKMFFGDFFNNVLLRDSLPLTRSAYSLSKRFTPLGSGLVIDLSNEDHNDDGQKYNEWLSHPSYNVVRDAAANFGFALDKHAPWRLIANLQSPKMLPYIQGKGLLQDKTIATRLIAGQPVQSSDVFNVFYDKIYKRDIDILKRSVYNFYVRFVENRPYISSAKSVGCSIDSSDGRAPTSRTMMAYRKKITYEQMENKYDDYFWLNQYFMIRIAEASGELNPEILQRQLKKVSYIKKYLGHDKALTYINEYVNILAPPLAKSLFGGAASSQNIQVTGQAASIPSAAATPGTSGY